MSERWRLRKGDRVCVLSGRDRGKSGEILKVLRSKRRVVVSGVNIVASHSKPSVSIPDGGIVRKEAPIHASNVSHIDPMSGKPTRIGVRFLDDGRKVRYAKRSGDLIDR